MDLGLKDKHVLITGASGGIGLELVRAFLKEDAKVTATYNHSRDELDRIQENWQKQLAVVKVDVREESEVKSLFEQSQIAFGRIDIMVANAGIANHVAAPIHEMSLKQWQSTMAVNLTGVFLCSKYFVENLANHQGDHASLILIGSTAGLFGEAGFADYATSKAALHGLMMSIKNEIVYVAKKGRVNLVNPGWTLTPMSEEVLADSKRAIRILQTISLRKTAVPEDIAGAILYLASDKLSGHITGQTLTVAGGMEGRVLYSREDLELDVER
jgi:NAD(P)-dependent dehydrogenase (short-subunit alcohol dehydrogenase family)